MLAEIIDAMQDSAKFQDLCERHGVDLMQPFSAAVQDLLHIEAKRQRRFEEHAAGEIDNLKKTLANRYDQAGRVQRLEHALRKANDNMMALKLVNERLNAVVEEFRQERTMLELRVGQLELERELAKKPWWRFW